jgi:polyisoprenyl-teichoic acid--peptidoglycan teichoic acid transferase
MTRLLQRCSSPFAVTVVAALLVALLAGNVAAAVSHRAELRTSYAHDGILTILIIGSDIGWPGRPGNELRGNADGLHLLAVDTAERRATIVSIPRDSLIGGTKVNAHLARGGPEAMVSQMAAYTGIAIDHYALTSMHGLRRMVTDMDGIEIDVERRMTATGGPIVLEPGRQSLTPDQALGFTRDRKSMPRGDFDRTANQGKLLRAAHEEIRRDFNNLIGLSRLSASFIRDTHTDIPRSEVLRLGVLATQIEPEHILLAPLAGGLGTTSGGASIVNPNAGDAFERIKAGQVGP